MVNSYCCVPGCKNICKKESLMRFVRFPPEGELKDKWQNAIGRKASEITEKSIICCEHFSISSYVVPGKVLRYNAVPTIFRDSNPPQKILSEETNQNCTSQETFSMGHLRPLILRSTASKPPQKVLSGEINQNHAYQEDVSMERLRPQIVRSYASKPPKKILSGEINQNRASQEDVSTEFLRPHSPPVEITISISEDEEMDAPETSEETDSIDLLYSVIESEDEEEQESALLELDSARTHYQRLVQQVVSAPDLPSKTFHRTRNANIQVKMGAANPLLRIKQMRKRIKALNKRKRGQDKLLKKMLEVTAIHEYKRLVEADYKQILGESIQEISPVDEPGKQLEEHSYFQNTKEADPNSETLNKTTAELSTTPLNAPQVGLPSVTQNETNHSES